MSEDDSGDQQGQLFGSKAKGGLSVSKEDAESRAGPSRRAATSAFERMQQAARTNDDIAARWFIPVSGLTLVLFLIVGAMLIAQSSRTRALESEIEALRGQVAASSGTDQGARMDQVLARIEELGARLDAVDEPGTEVQALRNQLTRQNQTIETLGSRLENLEQALSSPAGATASGSTQASGRAAGGDWVINLITVGDRESATSFQERAAKLGIDARIEAVTRGDETLQRVVVPGYQSEDAAQKAALDMKKRLELSDDPWITRQ